MFIRLLGIGLAAGLLAVSAPVMAETSAAPTFIEEMEAAPLINDCLASFDASAAVLFVEAESGCDVVLAEATGLCLAPAAAAPLERIAAVLDPEQGVSCTTLRPSPPG
jgi:hypothetical protein